MALPVQFASLSSPTMNQLDLNFNALGALTPIPCAVAGTNALTLTPAANTPAVAAYANYMQFTGIAAATSTGLMTAQVGALAALNVYADSSSGVAQATTGQVVLNTAFTLMYDSTLNAGAGGFHLLSAVAVGSFLPLAGGTLTGALKGTSITLTGALTAASASGATLTGTSFVSAPTISSASLFSGVAMNLTGAATVGTSLTVGGNVSVGKLGIAAGNLATRMLWTTATLTFGAIAPQATNDQTIALTGATVGDQVLAGVPAAPTAGIVYFPFVSATNTVIMRAANITAATLTPPAGIYQASLLGFD